MVDVPLYPPELAALTATGPDAYRIVHYGRDANQFGELWPPTGARHPAPVVVLVHGGYWRDRYRLDLMHAMAADLAGRGYAVWNVEYRRVGSPGGGWPGTFLDVAAAFDALAGLAAEHRLDLTRVAAVGHSAGGHLALWACGRGRLAERGTGRSGPETPPAQTEPATPARFAPGDLAPADRASGNLAPTDHAPADRAPTDHASPDLAPADRASADLAPADLALTDLAPTDLAPALFAPPRVTPALAVSLAGVCDLRMAAELGLSDNAVRGLLGGGPEEIPAVYDVTCPVRLLPLGVPQVVLHGTGDVDVPLELSTGYARRAGAECELVVLPGADHIALIDPGSAAWPSVLTALARL